MQHKEYICIYAFSKLFESKVTCSGRKAHVVFPQSVPRDLFDVSTFAPPVKLQVSCGVVCAVNAVIIMQSYRTAGPLSLLRAVKACQQADLIR